MVLEFQSELGPGAFPTKVQVHCSGRLGDIRHTLSTLFLACSRLYVLRIGYYATYYYHRYNQEYIISLVVEEIDILYDGYLDDF